MFCFFSGKIRKVNIRKEESYMSKKIRTEAVGKVDLAKRAKAANLDAIHDTVHEMARDEARHGKAFEGLLKRYFG